MPARRSDGARGRSARRAPSRPAAPEPISTKITMPPVVGGAEARQVQTTVGDRASAEHDVQRRATPNSAIATRVAVGRSTSAHGGEHQRDPAGVVAAVAARRRPARSASGGPSSRSGRSAPRYSASRVRGVRVEAALDSRPSATRNSTSGQQRQRRQRRAEHQRPAEGDGAGAAATPAPPRRASHASRTRNANQQTVTNITWKLVSGCPPRNWSATSAASPATGSGPGRRTTQLGEQQDPRDQREDVRQRPGQPDDEEGRRTRTRRRRAARRRSASRARGRT